MDSPPIAPPSAVLFDAYGTLFDIYSVTALAEELFPGQGAGLAAGWRDKQIEYTRLCSMSGRYRPFRELTLAGLRYAALRLGLVLDADRQAKLMDRYSHLDPFPENREVLATLKARGIPAGILSNGDPDMLRALVDHAGFGPYLDPVVSVQGLFKYKTDPEAYALGADALGLSPGEILFVSSNGWDALGATWFGHLTLWVNRLGMPPEQLDTPPTRVGSSLRDVLDFFPTSKPT